MSRFLGSLLVKGKNGFYGYTIPQNHDGAGRLISAQQYDQPQRYVHHRHGGQPGGRPGTVPGASRDVAG